MGVIKWLRLIDGVFLQTQGPFSSSVLERGLIPHHHVPESGSTDNWLIQPRCVQPAVWYARPVSEYCQKPKNKKKKGRSEMFSYAHILDICALGVFSFHFGDFFFFHVEIINHVSFFAWLPSHSQQLSSHFSFSFFFLALNLSTFMPLWTFFYFFRKDNVKLACGHNNVIFSQWVKGGLSHCDVTHWFLG